MRALSFLMPQSEPWPKSGTHKKPTTIWPAWEKPTHFAFQLYGGDVRIVPYVDPIATLMPLIEIISAYLEIATVARLTRKRPFIKTNHRTFGSIKQTSICFQQVTVFDQTTVPGIHKRISLLNVRGL